MVIGTSIDYPLEAFPQIPSLVSTITQRRKRLVPLLGNASLSQFIKPSYFVTTTPALPIAVVPAILGLSLEIYPPTLTGLVEIPLKTPVPLP